MGHAFGKAVYHSFMWLLRRRAGLTPAVTTAGGVHVPVLQRMGTKPPIVLVHGFGADKEGWLNLAALFPRERPLLLPDLPGYGAAGAIDKSRASAGHQARALAEIMRARGIDKAHIVGSSMGGGIALRLGVDAPERVLSLTLVGSAGPIPEKSELGHALDRGENPLLVSSPEDIERLLDFVAEKRQYVPRPVLRYIGSERARMRTVLDELFWGFTHPQPGDEVPTDDIAKIRAPTLVVHGEKDRVIHPATGRALARGIPGAELFAMADIGHVPHVEAPGEVAARITAFVDRVDTAA